MRPPFYILLLVALFFPGLMGVEDSGSDETVRTPFEGQIDYIVESLEAENEAVLEVPQRVRLMATSHRIFLNSNYRYRVFRGLNANGFIVRNDQSDFVFLNGNEDAFVISREEVDGFGSMIQRFQGSGQSDSFDRSGRVEETDERKQIFGYDVEKVRLHEQDSDNYMDVWLTHDIQMNWGILEEAWHQSLAGIINLQLPLDLFMNRNSFPLEMIYYEEGRPVMRVDAVNIDRRTLRDEQVEIPEGVKMIGYADLMMRMMLNR